MKKLSDAAMRYLQAFPPDFELDGRIIPGQIRNCNAWPKNTSVSTVRRLYSLGLIKHADINPYNCPMCLTERGKRVLNP